MKRIEINYGRLKVWSRRMRENLSFLQFLMICALFFDNITFEWWHLLIVAGFFALSYYDNDKGFAQELEYSSKKNKILMEMYNKIMKGE